MLLLRPATPGRTRAIVDAGSGKPVGFARPQPDVGRGWLGSFLGPLLSIHEQEEEPLVFTVRRCVLRWTQHEVRDAEEERVGFVTSSAIRDRHGFLYATRRSSVDGGVYQCVNGDSLAVTRRTPAGFELAFTKVIEAEPFAKMLLLAATLFQE